MRWNQATGVYALALLLAAGCAAGRVQEVPIALRYIPVQRDMPRGAVQTVAVGVFRDAREGRPAGIVGERVRFTGDTDRFKPATGVAEAVADVVRGYLARRGARTQATGWDGTPAQLWGQPGDIAVAGRVTHLWLSARDLATRGEASSLFRVELIVGSPRSGAIITKTIQIEPTKRSNLFFETRDIEEWLSQSISEAIERVMPDLERRLAG